MSIDGLPGPSGPAWLTAGAAVEVVVAPDAQAPSVARAFLAEHGQGLSAEMLADAELLISELITNAVRYGEPTITLSVRPVPPGVGVAVRDQGGDIPDRTGAPPPPDKPSGRGLLIVEAVADSWGVEPSNPLPGKTVWFTLGP